MLVVSGYVLVLRPGMTVKDAPALGVVGPGRLIGVIEANDPDRVNDSLSYRVHEDATIAFIPTRFLHSLLDAEPSLWRAMADMVLRHSREMMGNLLDHVVGDLRVRLAATIEQFAAQHGVAGGGTMTLRLRLTQGELADILQVSRQTINKTLGLLEREGVIAPDYNAISILDRAALQRIAGKRPARAETSAHRSPPRPVLPTDIAAAPAKFAASPQLVPIT